MWEVGMGASEDRPVLLPHVRSRCVLFGCLCAGEKVQDRQRADEEPNILGREINGLEHALYAILYVLRGVSFCVSL